MSGLSVRNRKYMKQFAAAWPDREIAQRAAAQLPWRTNQALLDKLDDPDQRLWYAEKVLEHGLSRDMLVLQIESHLHERHGRAQTNVPTTLPPADSDLAAQIFKDPYVFDFLGNADDKPSIGLLLVKEKDSVVVEYALAGTGKPMGVAVWKREITRSLPEELRAGLPSVEEIEAELARAPGRQA